MRVLTIPFTVLVAAAAHGQQTWTVPTNAPTLQAAIDAALPGDTITMTPGFTDAGNVVLGKALTLANCSIGYPDRAFGLRIVGLAGGTRLELRDVAILHVGDGFYGGASAALRIELGAAATGGIVLDRVRLTGPVNGTDIAALRVLSAGAATLTARNCTIVGKAGSPLPYQAAGERGPVGGDGVVLAPGKYLFEDCTLRGGRGGLGYASWRDMVAGANGGAALVAAGDTALVRCTLTDGDGGDAVVGSPPPIIQPLSPCTLAAQPGVSVLPDDQFDVTYQPGRIGAVYGCPNQPPQPPAQSLGRSTDVQPAAATFTTGQPIAIQFSFLPTDTAALFGVGLPPRRGVLPGILGPLWMEQVVFSMFLTPPTPGATIAVPLPSVPPGLPGPVDFVVQALHGSSSAPPEIGAPRVVTIRP